MTLLRIFRRKFRSPALELTVTLLFATSIAGAEPLLSEGIGEGANSGTTSLTVLTLEEAALLLRVEPVELEELALEQRVPGRMIGDDWRFSREALLAWLAGTGPWAPNDGMLSAAVGGDTLIEIPMSEAALESTVGRGPAIAGEASAIAGDPPETKSSEQIFLRRKRLLLDRGQFIVEPWLAYAKGEANAIRGFEVQFGNVTLNVPQLISEEQETTTVALGVRYGLFDQTELYAMGRYRYRNLSERSHLRDPSAPQLVGVPEGESHLGRLYLGARRTLFGEDALLPDIVLSAEVGIPISKTSFSAGTGLWLVRSYDPISLFAGIEYRHTFSRNFDDLSLLEPEDIFGVTVGYSFAVNDRLSLSTAVSALFTDQTKFSTDITMESNQSYGLRLALTHMLREGMYVEPHVTLGLNNPGSWMMLGVSVPMTFD